MHNKVIGLLYYWYETNWNIMKLTVFKKNNYETINNLKKECVLKKMCHTNKVNWVWEPQSAAAMPTHD